MVPTSGVRDALAALLVALLMGVSGTARAAIIPPAIDDRTYDDLVAELAERIPQHTPEWTEQHTSDPGFTPLEFFALTDDSVLDEIIAENQDRAWWAALPPDDEAFLGELAYSLLEAALTVATAPGQTVPEDWPDRYGIDPSWSYAELLARARVPEPSALVLVVGAVGFVLAQARRRPAPDLPRSRRSSATGRCVPALRRYGVRRVATTTRSS
jgi:hypothetical protein